jgi:uracil-DNA glycosylase
LEPTAGAFFRHVQQLALGIAGGGDLTDATRRIAWTNLARIGYAGGNPAGRTFDAQETLCRWLLAAELDWLRPDLVVLLTGDYRHDLVSDFFDGIVWEYLLDAGHDTTWCGCWHDIRVVLTMHPQGKSLERLERERRAIAAWFAGRPCR